MFDSDETLLIGVDGGGSGCRAAVGSRHKGVLAEAAGGSANISTDLETSLQNVTAAVEAACARAGVSLDNLKTARAHLGLAGIMSPADGEAVAARLPFRHAVVTEDRPTTMMAALDGADGFVAAIGTGTFLASSRAGAQQRFVGGWGNRVADQASGGWLGCQALTKTLLCYDGVLAHTDLTRAVLRDFDDDPVAISDFSLSASPAEYGRFCPRVVQAAQDGDPIGAELMTSGAAFLRQALMSLDMQSDDVLVLGGGVGRFYKPYLEELLPNAMRKPKFSTVIGAFKLAQQAEEKARGVSV